MIGVVFCEGKNDNHFVGEVLQEGFYEREFNAESISAEEVLPKESKIIRQFIQFRRGGKAILLKSEQGRPQLMEVAGMYLPQLANEEVFQSIVIDLDGDHSHGEIISSVESETNKRIPNSVEFESEGTKVENSYFIGERLEIHINGELVDTFGFISFINNVEAAAGVNDDPPSDSIRESINEFVEENPDVAEEAASILI